MTDDELMGKYKHCDNEAGNQLYTLYSPRLRSFFRSTGSSEHVADDLVQEVFLRLHRYKHSFDSSRKFSAWIYTIATRVRWDRSKADGEIKVTDLTGQQMQGDGADGFDDGMIVAVQPTAQDMALASELRRDVHECLDSLPDRELLVILLWLHLGQKVPVAELAHILELSTAHACKIQQSALKKMRHCLLRRALGTMKRDRLLEELSESLKNIRRIRNQLEGWRPPLDDHARLAKARLRLERMHSLLEEDAHRRKLEEEKAEDREDDIDEQTRHLSVHLGMLLTSLDEANPGDLIEEVVSLQELTLDLEEQLQKLSGV